MPDLQNLFDRSARAAQLGRDRDDDSDPLDAELRKVGHQGRRTSRRITAPVSPSRRMARF